MSSSLQTIETAGFRTSAHQRRLLHLSQGGEAVSQLTAELDFGPDVAPDDAARLLNTHLEAVIDHHEMLRMKVEMAGDLGLVMQIPIGPGERGPLAARFNALPNGRVGIDMSAPPEVLDAESLAIILEQILEIWAGGTLEPQDLQYVDYSEYVVDAPEDPDCKTALADLEDLYAGKRRRVSLALSDG